MDVDAAPREYHRDSQITAVLKINCSYEFLGYKICKYGSITRDFGYRTCAYCKETVQYEVTVIQGCIAAVIGGDRDIIFEGLGRAVCPNHMLVE